ncbi:hypothetical protein [Pelagovum pacificum]|uniref:Secreted protein n=1 Tax=Pelagovum pacificum TaxID=2588711 RepID=A0A5C5GJI5_9RHOB|nr:hypothetical protein [Pelagovum pacificum]QQA42820.1 hypothetical protein I8N54_18950 [Pelagovum pacificum]TNY34031.1 hypothetical protein FHY64_12435 [Pelagovum pacificum]
MRIASRLFVVVALCFAMLPLGAFSARLPATDGPSISATSPEDGGTVLALLKHCRSTSLPASICWPDRALPSDVDLPCVPDEVAVLLPATGRFLSDPGQAPPRRPPRPV